MYHTTNFFLSFICFLFYNILFLQSKVHLMTMNPGESLLSRSQAISFLAKKKGEKIKKKKREKFPHQELGAKVSYIILRTSPLAHHQVWWRPRVYCPVCMCVYACVTPKWAYLFRKHSRVVCVFVKDCSKCCVAMPIVRCECTLFNVQQMIPDSICINIFYVKYVSFIVWLGTAMAITDV